MRKLRFKRFWRRLGNPRAKLLLGGVIVLSLGMAYMFNNESPINSTAYVPLLNTIAKGESGGNYNAYFGSPKNNDIKFTKMTISEVLEWQAEHVKKGNVSSAVGKYQIIQPTLAGLVDQLKIDHDEKFDETLQDKLAIKLLERRGSVAYVNNELSREQFATNLAMEWAALPKASGPDAHKSYYAADGINKSNITVDEVFTALDKLQSQARK